MNVTSVANSEQALSPRDRCLSLREAQRFLHVRRSVLLGWIHSGRLPAFNVGNARRPKYRIPPDSLQMLLLAPEPTPKPRRRAPPKPDGWVERY